MADRFLVLRGTPDGPAYLAPLDQPYDAEAWTLDRAGARRFDGRADAEAAQGEAVARGVTAAVVPDAR